MKLKDLFQLAIKLAMDADPRSKKEIEDELKRRKKKYDKMSKEEKKYFDQETLKNPYHDSRILHANSMEDEIKTILTGIDMEYSELLLATELERRGKKIDLVLSHHPEGRGLLDLAKVMPIQNDIMEDVGVPINVAEKILYPRMQEINRAVHPDNFIRSSDTARLLDINYACTHTIADHLVYNFIKKKICDRKNYYTVGDIVDALMKIPEYQMASKAGNPPIVVCGSKEARAGKVAPTGMTGGTSNSEKIYAELSRAGVGTIITMHIGEKNRKEAEKHHLNVIVAGHIASDSLGMNLLLDQFEKKKVKIIPCGMFRVKR